MVWLEKLKEKFPDVGESARIAELLVLNSLEADGYTVFDYESDPFCQTVVGVDLSAWKPNQAALGIQVKDNYKQGYFVVEVNTIREKNLVNRHYHVDTKHLKAISYRTEEMCGYINRRKPQTFLAHGELCTKLKPGDLPFKIFHHDLSKIQICTENK